MKQTSSLPGEFELIARYFAPLAKGFPGAYGLLDDAAVIAPPPGHELVAKSDAIVGGVHFLHDDPPDLIARKALRVNLSDLAAKGAVPRAYMLDIMLPRTVTEEWIAAFARGLAQDQDEYGVHLIGGDTDSTPGPVAIAIMAFGDVAAGQLIRRCGAHAGDMVFVTGTIGDAALGLQVLRAALALGPGRTAAVLAGGDDYEILFTAAPTAMAELTELSRTLDVPITAIGRMAPSPIAKGARVTVLDESGRPLSFERDGWAHF